MKYRNIIKFEMITDNSKKIVGGFSKSISKRVLNYNNVTISNNCLGGNCTSGCGTDPTTNLCNAAQGCCSMIQK